jgi:hypothetical protein
MRLKIGQADFDLRVRNILSKMINKFNSLNFLKEAYPTLFLWR